MEFLIDTHTLLWSITDPAKLSSKAASLLKDPANEIYVSTINFWEISLKVSLGKIFIKGFRPEDLPALVRQQDFSIIYPGELETSTFHRLSRKQNHKDPFDRFLIWQSITRDLNLISCDKAFIQYVNDGLKLVW
jgi:PIN domain nuclease of toxin-antitoxin system